MTSFTPLCWASGPPTDDGMSQSCMLPRGHAGEHQWTRNDEIVVTVPVVADLDAATSVRAPAVPAGMEIIRAVAAIELWRDTNPNGFDLPLNQWLKCFGLTPDHVRQARAIVAAERKEAREKVRNPDAAAGQVGCAVDDDGYDHTADCPEGDAPMEGPEPPPTAGPIPPAGASSNEPDWDAISNRLSAETERLLATAPSPQPAPNACACDPNEGYVCKWCCAQQSAPQPPAPAAAPDVARVRVWDEERGAHFLQDQGAPDVAQLISRVRQSQRNDHVCSAAWKEVGDALTAQAAEIDRLRMDREIARGDRKVARSQLREAAAALAAKDAEIESLKDNECCKRAADLSEWYAATLAAKDADIGRLSSHGPGTPLGRLKGIAFILGRIATLEAALRDVRARTYSSDRGCELRADAVAAISDLVGAALAQKEPQQP